MAYTRPRRRRQLRRRAPKRLTRSSRITRKRITRRPRMTRKRILNMTSTKKKDKMATFTNIQLTDPNAPQATYVRQPVRMIGGASNTDPYIIPWICTARTGEKTPGVPGNAADQSTRTKTDCYMVGLGESIRFETSNALPWLWRRICFTLKGPGLYQNAVQGTYFQSITSNGYFRLASSMLSGSNGKGFFYDFVFEGTGPSDWIDPFYAQLDRRNITVKYDSLSTIKSQNDFGTMQSRKLFHPMRSNLSYADDELGGGETYSPVSTVSKLGMGDYYVIDLFRPQQTATNSSVLQVDYESTLYWHEK